MPNSGARAGLLLLAAGLVLGLLGRAAPVQAQITLDEPVYVHGKRVVSIRQVPPEIAPAPLEVCVYRATGRTAGTVVRGPSLRELTALRAEQEARARITLTYEGGFPGPAREALRRAADIWEGYIESPVPIQIHAAWVDTLGQNTLASAASNFVFAFEFDNGEFLAYPHALTDALTGQDAHSGVPASAPEIVMYVNALRDDWYFGTGDPAPGEIDFATVALHEITHGLGFSGSMAVNSGVGSWGYQFSGIDGPVPAAYDVSRSGNTSQIVSAAEDLSGDRLTNMSIYPNPSEALAEALTDSVFFDGPQARRGNATDPDAPDVRPELFAPSDWQQGSSYSHLAEGAYPEGDVNALMTPFIASDEVIESPGGIVCGILGDMGWPLTSQCRKFLSALIVFNPMPLSEQDAVNIKWVIDANSEIEEVRIRQCNAGRNQCADSDFQTIATVPVGQGSVCTAGQEDKITCTYPVSDLEPGAYTFRLILVETDGTETPGFKEEVFLRPDERIVRVYPNPFHGDATLQILFAEEPPTRLTVELYDALGRHVRRWSADQVEEDFRFTIEAAGLASGMYFVRVSGEDLTAVEQIAIVH